MSGNPIEETFVGQAILIVGLALAMILSGQAVGTRFHALEIPYAERIGFVIGAAVVFAVFAVPYRYYGAAARGEWKSE